MAGTGTSRSITVTNATVAGDTILVLIGFNTASMSASAVTDSKGNVYTMDGSFTTTSPYTYGFRCPGATGGSGGGATAALTTSDTLTVTTGSVSGTMSASVISHPAGVLDLVSAIAIISAAVTGSVSVTPSVNGDLCIAADINQPAASALTMSGSFAMFDSRQPAGAGTGLYTSWATFQLAAGAGSGAAQTQTINWTGSSNWRGIAWAFKPTAVALLPQQARRRAPAVFTRIASPSHEAVYSR